MVGQQDPSCYVCPSPVVGASPSFDDLVGCLGYGLQPLQQSILESPKLGNREVDLRTEPAEHRRDRQIEWRATFIGSKDVSYIGHIDLAFGSHASRQYDEHVLLIPGLP